MNILLAPAESKSTGGAEASFNIKNFFLEDNFDKRKEVLDLYETHVENLSHEELSSWFSLKKMSEVARYKESLLGKAGKKAILRYTGVAFDAISYESLNKEAQNYIDENVIIFSNLFGPIKAKDIIPDYKFKQGAKLPSFNLEKYYLEHFSKSLDACLDDEIIDLRAGYYEKFYKCTNKKVLCFKFLKDGKVISHWAKHYRGILLNVLSKNNIQSFSEFMHLSIPGLEVIEIEEKKNVKTMIMSII